MHLMNRLLFSRHVKIFGYIFTDNLQEGKILIKKETKQFLISR